MTNCKDCNLPYDEFGLDVLFPRNQWLTINPTDSGVLCANCMIKRAKKINGAIVVHAVVEVLNSEQGVQECDANGLNQGTEPMAQKELPSLQSGEEPNECPYEAAVIRFFGLPPYVTEKTEIKTDLGMLVNMMALPIHTSLMMRGSNKNV